VGLVAALLLALAGCGGAPPTATRTLATGSQVGPQRYLADTAEGAAAVRDFAAVLDRMAVGTTPARIRGLAAGLDAPLARARLAKQRLGAERLEDRRLESQRKAAAAGYASVLGWMERTASAAHAGNQAALRSAAVGLRRAVERLRAVGRPAGGG
jgi:hypothetical protein